MFTKYKYNYICCMWLIAAGLSCIFMPACSKESDNNNKLWSEKEHSKAQKSEIESITPQTFVELAENQKPAVVNISITKTIKGHPKIYGSPHRRNRNPLDDFFERFFGNNMPQEDLKQKSLGTGFIISKDGYILTNAHVVEDVDEILITLSNKKEFKAKVIGVDHKTDIGLIKIKSWKDLPVASLGDSDSLKVGEWVMAIGNPFGLEHTITAGIISAMGRVIGAGPYDNFIQTDASINPGNSGGPLFNIYGEVVGINTAILPQGQGIGFAIPINAAKDILADLKDKGEVERGWLGVLVQEVTPELAESFGLKEAAGALLAEVFEGSPADKAGLKQGDIVVQFDGDKIDDHTHLSRLAAKAKPHSTINVVVIRNGKRKKIDVNIGLYPKDGIPRSGRQKDKSSKYEDVLGLKISELNAQLRDYFETDVQSGVIIIELAPNAPAKKSGLLVGDVILEINRHKIDNLEDCKQTLEKVNRKKSILFLVQRGSNSHFVAVKPD